MGGCDGKGEDEEAQVNQVLLLAESQQHDLKSFASQALELQRLINKSKREEWEKEEKDIEDFERRQNAVVRQDFLKMAPDFSPYADGISARVVSPHVDVIELDSYALAKAAVALQDAEKPLRGIVNIGKIAEDLADSLSSLIKPSPKAVATDRDALTLGEQNVA